VSVGGKLATTVADSSAVSVATGGSVVAGAVVATGVTLGGITVGGAVGSAGGDGRGVRVGATVGAAVGDSAVDGPAQATRDRTKSELRSS
jgi:hypothetical protein